jgi:hypothetical protein
MSDGDNTRQERGEQRECNRVLAHGNDPPGWLAGAKTQIRHQHAPLPFDLPSVRRKKLTVDFADGNQSSNGGSCCCGSPLAIASGGSAGETKAGPPLLARAAFGAPMIGLGQPSHGHAKQNHHMVMPSKEDVLLGLMLREAGGLPQCRPRRRWPPNCWIGHGGGLLREGPGGSTGTTGVRDAQSQPHATRVHRDGVVAPPSPRLRIGTTLASFDVVGEPPTCAGH